MSTIFPENFLQELSPGLPRTAARGTPTEWYVMSLVFVIFAPLARSTIIVPDTRKSLEQPDCLINVFAFIAVVFSEQFADTASVTFGPIRKCRDQCCVKMRVPVVFQ